MRLITKQIDLNVSQPNNYELLTATKGSSCGVIIEATIWDKNIPFNLSHLNVAIRGKTESGTKIYTRNVEIIDNKVVFPLTINMLDSNCILAIEFSSSEIEGTVVLTYPFMVNVVEEEFETVTDNYYSLE